VALKFINCDRCEEKEYFASWALQGVYEETEGENEAVGNWEASGDRAWSAVSS